MYSYSPVLLTCQPEFFCQHPRWHQKGRYDKLEQGATQGNKAPCSVYMSHSPSSNTTFYMVVAPDDGVWLSFIDRIQTGKGEDGDAPISNAVTITMRTGSGVGSTA